MSRSARLALVAGFIVVAVAGFVLARSGSDDDGGEDGTVATAPATARHTTSTTARPQPPAPPRIVVREGRPVGGIKELRAKIGQRVAFTVVSDVSDEVHVHGYDLSKDVRAGGGVTFAFRATSDGVYEIELENRGEQIAELRVTP